MRKHTVTFTAIEVFGALKFAYPHEFSDRILSDSPPTLSVGDNDILTIAYEVAYQQ